MKKKRYTREEKIAYYTALKKKAEQRLQYLTSDEYQEWDGGVAKELRLKKQASEIARQILAEMRGEAF